MLTALSLWVFYHLLMYHNIYIYINVQIAREFDLVTMSFTSLKIFHTPLKMRYSKEVKEVVAFQRADLVHEVIVYKHIVGICSTDSSK